MYQTVLLFMLFCACLKSFSILYAQIALSGLFLFKCNSISLSVLTQLIVILKIKPKKKSTSAADNPITCVSSKLTVHSPQYNAIPLIYIPPSPPTNYPPVLPLPPTPHINIGHRHGRAVHHTARPAYRQTTCTSHQHQNKKETLRKRKMLLENNTTTIWGLIGLSVCLCAGRRRG